MLKLLAIFFLIFQHFNPSFSICPPDSRVSGNKGYWPIVVQNKILLADFSKALEICEDLGGTLPSINSEQDQYAIWDSMVLKVPFTDLNSTNFWTGGIDPNGDHHYYWVDGTANFNLTNEGKKPIVNAPYRHGPHARCLAYSGIEGYKGVECQTKHPVVCQFDVDVKCPAGWEYFEQTKSCYKIVRQSVTPELGRHVCQLELGDLVSIHTKEENKFIGDQLLGEGEKAWIGYGVETGKDGDIKARTWTDGSTVNYTGPLDEYGKGKRRRVGISDVAEGASKTCFYFYRRKSGNQDWISDDCDTEQYFVCKRPELEPIGPKEYIYVPEDEDQSNPKNPGEIPTYPNIFPHLPFKTRITHLPSGSKEIPGEDRPGSSFAYPPPGANIDEEEGIDQKGASTIPHKSIVVDKFTQIKFGPALSLLPGYDLKNGPGDAPEYYVPDNEIPSYNPNEYENGEYGPDPDYLPQEPTEYGGPEHPSGPNVNPDDTGDILAPISIQPRKDKGQKCRIPGPLNPEKYRRYIENLKPCPEVHCPPCPTSTATHAPPTTTPPKKNFSCPEKWWYISQPEINKCYKVLDKKYTWEIARKACLREQGHLVRIVNQAQDMTVRDIVFKLVVQQEQYHFKNVVDRRRKIDISHNSAWIGLSAMYPWSWVDEPVANYTNWAPNQPNNLTAECTCITIPHLGVVQKFWYGAKCAEKLRPICERYSDEVIPQQDFDSNEGQVDEGDDFLNRKIVEPSDYRYPPTLNPEIPSLGVETPASAEKVFNKTKKPETKEHPYDDGLVITSRIDPENPSIIYKFHEVKDKKHHKKGHKKGHRGHKHHHHHVHGHKDSHTKEENQGFVGSK